MSFYTELIIERLCIQCFDDLYFWWKLSCLITSILRLLRIDFSSWLDSIKEINLQIEVHTIKKKSIVYIWFLINNIYIIYFYKVIVAGLMLNNNNSELPFYSLNYNCVYVVLMRNFLLWSYILLQFLRQPTFVWTAIIDYNSFN